MRRTPEWIWRVKKLLSDAGMARSFPMFLEAFREFEKHTSPSKAIELLEWFQSRDLVHDEPDFNVIVLFAKQLKISKTGLIQLK